jgi:methylenetetrahydrofolate reductase (NADPH)
MNTFRRQHHTTRPAGPRVSFEFFPPKGEEGQELLWSTVQRIVPLQPHFVSVTYGAGGTDQERSFATLERLLAGTNLAPAAHLTCVGATAHHTDAIVDRLWDMGVRHVVALRGDMPGGAGAPYVPTKGGYANAAELVAGIAERYPDMEISVSAYPECHPESASFQADLDNLAAKVDAGATRAITQFFFDNDRYLRFVDAAQDRGINIPILPGIMPVRDLKQVAGFAARCGTGVPSWFAQRFEGLDSNPETDPETRRMVGVSVAAEQVQDLIDHGVDAFHFYSMNRADMVLAICHLIGVTHAIAA